MRWITGTLAVLLLATAGVAQAPPDPAAILARVRTLLKEKDEYAAIEYVQGLGSIQVVATAYSNLVRDLQWKAKDPSAAIVIGRAGILDLLMRGRLVAKQSPEGAMPYLSQAKTLAYNVGSFAWPGWGEESLKLTPTEAHAGHEAAKLNLRLALELKKPAGPMSNAHWLLGAHRLSAKRTDEAVKSFAEAERLAKESGSAEGELMSRGYGAIARLLGGDGSAKKELTSAIAALEKLGTGDAKVYLDQLRSVPDALRTWWKENRR